MKSKKNFSNRGYLVLWMPLLLLICSTFLSTIFNSSQATSIFFKESIQGLRWHEKVIQQVATLEFTSDLSASECQTTFDGFEICLQTLWLNWDVLLEKHTVCDPTCTVVAPLSITNSYVGNVELPPSFCPEPECVLASTKNVTILDSISVLENLTIVAVGDITLDHYHGDQPGMVTLISTQGNVHIKNLTTMKNLQVISFFPFQSNGLPPLPKLVVPTALPVMYGIESITRPEKSY
jgi:hypothetical protein